MDSSRALFGNVFVDDQGEFRLPLTNGILLSMDLDIETVLVKMPQIIKEKMIHHFMKQHDNRTPFCNMEIFIVYHIL